MTRTVLGSIDFKPFIAGWLVLLGAHVIGFSIVSAHEPVLITMYFLLVIASILASGMIFCKAISAEMVKKMFFAAANLALYFGGIWLLYAYFGVKS